MTAIHNKDGNNKTPESNFILWTHGESDPELLDEFNCPNGLYFDFNKAFDTPSTHSLVAVLRLQKKRRYRLSWTCSIQGDKYHSGIEGLVIHSMTKIVKSSDSSVPKNKRWHDLNKTAFWWPSIYWRIPITTHRMPIRNWWWCILIQHKDESLANGWLTGGMYCQRSSSQHPP